MSSRFADPPYDEEIAVRKNEDAADDDSTTMAQHSFERTIESTDTAELVVPESEAAATDTDERVRHVQADEFPSMFYDPVSAAIMIDPVVNPAGDSYDRSTMTSSSKSIVCYPNRALQSIIQHAIKQHSGTDTILPVSSVSTSQPRQLWDAFHCPITCDVMVDPVICPDGTTYEREAIENWVRANAISPSTREPLALADIRANNALYELIQLELRRPLESILPVIRQWKELGGIVTTRPTAVLYSDATLTPNSSACVYNETAVVAVSAPITATTDSVTTNGPQALTNNTLVSQSIQHQPSTTPADRSAERRVSRCWIAGIVFLPTPIMLAVAHLVSGDIVGAGILAALVVIFSWCCCLESFFANRCSR